MTSLNLVRPAGEFIIPVSRRTEGVKVAYLQVFQGSVCVCMEKNITGLGHTVLNHKLLYLW